MDEELVSTPSSVKRGGAYERPSSLFAYLLPYYMSYGMSYEDFWHGDVHLAEVYLKKHMVELEEKNQNMWLQGIYFLSAISCLDKNGRYPKEPFAITQKEQEERNERDAYDKFQMYMSAFMAKNNEEKEE